MRIPIIKVKFEHKWYGLEVHHPNGKTEYVDFPDEPNMGGSPYVDHAPNPLHVAHWAHRMGYAIDVLSLEMMIGRWELECGEGRYDSVVQELI